MMVTNIQDYTKTKVKVSLDTREDFHLYKREVVKYNIEVGQELSNYELILNETLIPRAKKRTMHLLEKMDRTERELRLKLRSNGYPDVAIDEAIAYVESYDYIDDERYAHSYVRSFRDSRSRNRIMQDMYRKGIDRDVVDNAIEDEYNVDEQELIDMYISKRKYSCDTATHKEREKMFRYLIGKGFELDTVRSVLG